MEEGDQAGKGRKGSKDFFFVNKKEAKKTLFTLDRAGDMAWGSRAKGF
jgi:hypothetical protein